VRFDPNDVRDVGSGSRETSLQVREDVVGLLAKVRASDNGSGDSMIIEMRTYKTKPGKRSQFLEIFRSRSISLDRRSGHVLFHARLSRCSVA
jgi:hypothetical protein